MQQKTTLRQKIEFQINFATKYKCSDQICYKKNNFKSTLPKKKIFGSNMCRKANFQMGFMRKGRYLGQMCGIM